MPCEFSQVVCMIHVQQGMYCAQVTNLFDVSKVFSAAIHR